MERETADPDRIDITVPARAEYVVVVRLAAAGIAGRMGFSYDEIEDLKIAVAEACTDAVLSGDGPLRVQFGVDGEALTVSVEYGFTEAERSEDRELGLFLIQCLMDNVATSEDGGRRTMRMVKRMSSSAGEDEPAS